VKTIIHLEITDDERAKMSQSLGHSGLVTRKQVTEFVEETIRNAIQPVKDIPTTASPLARSADEGRRTHFPVFTPSRGDEPYLYRPKDPKLAALCSTALDGLERLDRYVWDKLEENRQ